MHKIPLTPMEEEGLRVHRLPIGQPSQLADSFRHGVAWALRTAAAPSAPAPAEVPMPVSEGTIAYEPQPYEPEWISSEPAYSESQLLAYAAAREAAAIQKLLLVMRRRVDDEDGSVALRFGSYDRHMARHAAAAMRTLLETAEAAVRAELGGKP